MQGHHYSLAVPLRYLLSTLHPYVVRDCNAGQLLLAGDAHVEALAAGCATNASAGRSLCDRLPKRTKIGVSLLRRARARRRVALAVRHFQKVFYPLVRGSDRSRSRTGRPRVRRSVPRSARGRNPLRRTPSGQTRTLQNDSSPSPSRPLSVKLTITWSGSPFAGIARFDGLEDRPTASVFNLPIFQSSNLPIRLSVRGLQSIPRRRE